MLLFRTVTAPDPCRGLARLALVVGLLLAVAAPSRAADLTPAALAAFAAQFDHSSQALTEHIERPPVGSEAERMGVRAGATLLRPATGDGIIEAPGGLIHNWRGAIFIPKVTLDQVVEVSRRYPDYPDIFGPITGAKVLVDDGTALVVQFRMKQSAGGMSATLDLRSRIRYVRHDARHVYSVSVTEDVHEIKDAGKPTERPIEPGKDHGYLWRAGSFSRFIAGDGGVYMEMETIALSRPFPPMLGWFIEPIARRLGQRSVERSMVEFRQAVLMRYAAE